MKLIPLTQGQFAQVNDEDFEWLNQWKWTADKSYSTFYAVRIEEGKKVYMHRRIMNTPIGFECDHKDRNGLNNLRVNLRNTTHRQNLTNTSVRKGCSSKFKGVCFNLKRQVFQSYISAEGKHIYLGFSKDEITAARLYDIAAKKYFGEFANINFK